MANESGGDINELPVECMAKAVSLTSPVDACRLSMVSLGLRLAAESDAVWEIFFPEDYKSIISNSSDPSLLSRYPSKKALYVSLCKNPILVDGGKKSFSLSKRSGKKCYTLSARDLYICWADSPTYWRWIRKPTSRFPRVAKLRKVCWFQIGGKFDTSLLSTSTQYTAYLLFQLTEDSYGFEELQIDVTVGFVGGESSKRKVFFNTQRMGRPRIFGRTGGNGPKRREDGWLEVELGEFFIEEGQGKELEVVVSQVHHLHWKSGLIVEGIDIRAKEGISAV